MERPPSWAGGNMCKRAATGIAPELITAVVPMGLAAESGQAAKVVGDGSRALVQPAAATLLGIMGFVL